MLPLRLDLSLLQSYVFVKHKTGKTQKNIALNYFQPFLPLLLEFKLAAFKRIFMENKKMSFS